MSITALECTNESADAACIAITHNLSSAGAMLEMQLTVHGDDFKRGAIKDEVFYWSIAVYSVNFIDQETTNVKERDSVEF